MKPELQTAAAIMTRGVVSLLPDMPVARAASMLLRRGYSGAPVLDAQGHLVGIFSEKDCMTVLADAAWNNRTEGTVADHMSREIRAVSPETDLFTIVQLFQTCAVRRLPVVQGGKMVGLVTRRDVLRALQHLEEQRAGSTAQPHFTLWELPAT